MSKRKQKEFFRQQIDSQFEMYDCLEDIKDKMLFNPQPNKIRRVNLRLAFMCCIIALISGVGSSLGTFLYLNSVYFYQNGCSSSSSATVEAKAYISERCDNYSEDPLAAYTIQNRFSFYLYVGNNYREKIETLYFYQVSYLINTDFNLVLFFYNSTGQQYSLNIHSDNKIGLINSEKFELTDKLTINIYESLALLLNASLNL